jgi:hypothetical protein
MKFIVDRTKWYRGQGFAQSRLLTPDGKRCCIGFVGQQVGCTDQELLNKDTVARLYGIAYERNVVGLFPAWMQNHDKLQNAYAINDNSEISDGLREAQLKEEFAKNGDEIEFIN